VRKAAMHSGQRWYIKQESLQQHAVSHSA
jgi:hypothetical protein